MKYLNGKKSKKWKRVCAVILVFGFLMAIPMTHNSGTLLGFLKGEEVFIASQQELDEVEDKIDDLEDEYSNIEGQLSQKAQELSDLLADKAILESDIAETQIAIDQTKLDLENARIKEQESYEAMMLRIQYMYENSTQDSIWDAILNAKGITDLLNRVEYINQVHTTDRDMLEEHKAIVREVETLAADLEMKMNDLVALQEIFEHQEVELENAMAALEAEAENFQEQLAAAQAEADRLAEEIREQNEAINNGNAGEDGSTDSPSYDPPFSTNVSGTELVNYALQFVGNPYKWGGNSLTEGCDCSGFVHLIFTHFGFTNVPRQSQAFKSYGQAVSFENIKAGDIVVYPGHVAIYIGNGCIVEAQSSRAGITCNRSVTCNTITAIRRVL